MEYTNKDHTFAICVYKESIYLIECIKSLINQNLKTNIIMCTSTPSEYLYELSKKYNIQLFVNEDGYCSIADDWNYAINCADTPLVTLAHQDDVYLPDYSKEIVNKLNTSNNPIIAFTDYCEIRNNILVTQIRNLKIKRLMLFPLKFKTMWKSKFLRRRILSFGSAICCPSVTYVKNKVPDDIFDSSYKVSLDWNAWEKLSRLKGEFVFVDEILMAHRIHLQSATTKNISESNRTREDYLLFCKFWPEPIARMIENIYKNSESQNKLDKEEDINYV